MRSIAVSLLIALAACGGHVDTKAAPPATPAPPQQAPNWTRAPWYPYADSIGVLDYGTGIIALNLDSDSAHAFPSIDTLTFFERPDSLSARVGAMLVDRPRAGEWTYASLFGAGLRANFLEYAYEESGVPVDSVDASGAWIRGIVASDRARVMLHGWARVVPGRTTLISWATHLPKQRLNFLDTSRATLFRSRADAMAGRNGAHLPASRYTMEGIDADGAFLRVRFRWPFEDCEDSDTVRHSTAEYYIRYLDARGRPLVFYPPRGC